MASPRSATHRCVLRLAVGIVLLVTVGVACTSGDDGAVVAVEPSASAVPTQPSAPTPERTPYIEPVPEGLTAAFPTADGGQLEWGDLAGSPALLWFWSPY